jgi:hypothetical protein
MSRPSPVRFFWVVLRPSGLLVTALLALVAYTTWLALLDPGSFDQALGLTVLGQMLVASTGYKERLTRGHFDPILAGNVRRLSVAAAHALMSIAPGVTMWAALGVIDRTVSGRHSIVYTAGGAVGFVYASLVVWAVSLRLGRYTGGVLWLLLLVGLASGHHVHVLREWYGASSVSLAITARAAAAALVLPLVLFGNAGHVEPMVLLFVVVGTLMVACAGLLSVTCLEAPLRDPE